MYSVVLLTALTTQTANANWLWHHRWFSCHGWCHGWCSGWCHGWCSGWCSGGAAGGARDGAAVIATASITFLWRLSFMCLTLATDATVAPGPLATAAMDAMDATERHPRVFTIRRADLLRRFRPSHAK
jgi:hypothetical protein